jgi:hypothetical protein
MLFNTWTDCRETWYVCHATWDHLNGVVHKSVRSVIPTVQSTKSYGVSSSQFFFLAHLWTQVEERFVNCYREIRLYVENQCWCFFCFFACLLFYAEFTNLEMYTFLCFHYLSKCKIYGKLYWILNVFAFLCVYYRPVNIYWLALHMLTQTYVCMSWYKLLFLLLTQ